MKAIKTFGQLLRDVRFDRNLSQAEIAEKLGLPSANFVSDIENNLRPPPNPNALLKMVVVLKVPPMDVLEAAAYSFRYRKEIKNVKSE